jgi:branched-chain amino acid transport system ATP-binding protein
MSAHVTPLRGSSILAVKELMAWYGESQALHGIDVELREGELVTLLGRNGAGKSTTLKALVGMLKTRSGSIRIGGTETIGLATRKIAGLGVGYVPEDRGIYGSLTVEENLLLPPKVAEGGFALEELFGLFPNLKERLHSHGNRLSGGEQQMLSIARVLRTGARILLLDEPTEGLAPVIVEQIGRTLKLLKDKGYTVLLVEQNFEFAQALADRHYIVEQGRVVNMYDHATADRSRARILQYLGV